MPARRARTSRTSWSVCAAGTTWAEGEAQRAASVDVLEAGSLAAERSLRVQASGAQDRRG